jgi:hypothetical protein
MSDFKELLNKTMDDINRNYYKENQEPLDLVCGHTIHGYTSGLIISGQKVGIQKMSAILVCPKCAYVLHDKDHPEHLIVKNLVRKRYLNS